MRAQIYLCIAAANGRAGVRHGRPGKAPIGRGLMTTDAMARHPCSLQDARTLSQALRNLFLIFMGLYCALHTPPRLLALAFPSANLKGRPRRSCRQIISSPGPGPRVRVSTALCVYHGPCKRETNDTRAGPGTANTFVDFSVLYKLGTGRHRLGASPWIASPVSQPTFPKPPRRQAPGRHVFSAGLSFRG